MKSIFFKLIFFSMMLFACSKPTDQPVKLRFWGMGAEGERVKTLIHKFEQENPAISVEVQSIPWTAAQEKLITAYASDNLPDIFQLGNTWIPQFVNLKALEILDERIRKSIIIDPTDYFVGIWKSNQIGNNIYGIPWYVDTRVLYYRNDILNAAGFSGPPKTWKELYQAALKIKNAESNPNTFPIYLPTNEWAPFILFAMQNGSQLLKQNNSLGNFSAPEFKTAFEYLMQFYWQNLVPTGTSQIVNVQQSFRDGDIAMYISGPWNVPETRRWMGASDSLWNTAPLPSPDENYPGLSLAGGSSLVISQNSEYKAECWQLLEFLSRPDNQLQFYKDVGDLPARRSAWGDSILVNHPQMRAFLFQLERVQTMPKIAEWEQIVFAKVQQYVEFTARRAMTIEEALQKLDKDVDQILEKRRWLLQRKSEIK